MVNGWLNLDKPIGISSAQAVTQIKRIFGIKKAGHLGTLDPLASGVLPIALDEATKTIPYLSCDLKAYNFTIKWGRQTTTDDLDGDIIRTSTIRPQYNQINCAIKDFIGEITQTPPQFSAIKIKGTRAYKLARSGQKVNIKPRQVKIHELKLISVDTINNSANFSMMCGSGVYVRSIARDLGIALNCFGHITKLRRTMVGDFRENKSVTIEQLIEKNTTVHLFVSFQRVTLESRKKEEEWIPVSSTGMTEDTGSNTKSFIIPIESALKSMFKVEISLEEAEKIRKGQEVILNNLRNLKNYDIFCTIVGNVPIAICSFTHGYVKPIRVFNILK
ncbi:trna pseudouridine synthase b [Wolbachia endosymbiont of Armadillidium vulgare str. wVulC]|uniref:tRNA pseudouridine(55) synthase TruB n=1 Tax=Wolbachia endosymbiont of Armadillidium vulgare TaxID=77039 RepID=UPI00064AC69B|nr:tRNA pseudouridine(55) synthase TruB [Wolbachia endosymbiont of Armadillidium vulgare]KLT22473.1 trna pseudouridine synthase b [Wolbachia endosymbiont of Armadillidium vulgare str. wVulC]OJH32846.1 tRNA pseudouridine synthase B [Wolbachia endosymbiont of Armadillidium vulgare]